MKPFHAVTHILDIGLIIIFNTANIKQIIRTPTDFFLLTKNWKVKPTDTFEIW